MEKNLVNAKILVDALHIAWNVMWPRIRPTTLSVIDENNQLKRSPCFSHEI